MKYLIASLLFFVSGFEAKAQTNFRTVMVDSNNTVQRPTNFWSANSNSINAVVGNAETFGGIDLIYKIQQSFFSGLTTETLSGSASASNSIVMLLIAGTNSNAIAAIRLIDRVNSETSQGSGTLFGSDSHTAWIRFEANPQQNGLMRFVLGNSSAKSTNIAEYPTNRAFGFELRRLSGDTNEVRLIAHNGTTNTNGPWVAVATIFRRQTIGVEQNKTSGEIKLWVGESASRPSVNTNATINGGPTNSAGASERTLEAGLFTTNTNSGSIAFNIFSSLVEIVD